MLLREAYADWQGSRNYFYNKRTHKISDNINDLIEEDDIVFSAEGLRNYLAYGYSVFGQTPLENICFLEPNTKVWADEEGKLQFQRFPDPFDEILKEGKSSSVQDVLECFHYKVNERLKDIDGPFIVPTSGGFDSRFINCMINEKRKVHAYTYGISEKQEESIETIYAKKLCETIDISWKQIELGNYNSLIPEWYQHFGAVTHAHGMYHMEFYNKISSLDPKGLVISGLYGDLWSGNWEISKITEAQALKHLGLSHGINIDPSVCKLKECHELRDAFFESNKDKLLDDDCNWRLVLASRTKIVLLSYLMRVPEWYGFETWSPFLDFEIVSKIINLPWEEKKKRKWQIEYFRDKGVLIGELGLTCDKSNVLDVYACHKIVPEPLDVGLLGEIIDEAFVENINRNLSRMTFERLKYYNAYLVLYPLQKLLEIKEKGVLNE